MRNVLLRLKKHKMLKWAAVIAAASFFILSCQSVPEKAGMESSVQLLPSGSDVIIRADISKSRDLVEPVISMLGGSIPEKIAQDFIERTETVWAGLDFDAEQSTGSIVAEGDYPGGLINWGLCRDSDWKKHKYSTEPELDMKLPYWEQKSGRSQLSIPVNEYLLASGGQIEEMLRLWAIKNNKPADPEWMEAERNSDVTIMTRNLTPEDYGRFIPELTRVPLKSLILTLNRIDSDYLFSGRFHMDSELSAFLFSTIFRALVIAAKDANGERMFPDLKQVKIIMDGSDVVLNGMKLPAETVAATVQKWFAAAGMSGMNGTN